MPKVSVPVLDRLQAKTVVVPPPPGVDGDCWLYTGKRKGQPHGDEPDNDHRKIRVKLHGRWTFDYVHRVSYREHHGEITDGMVVRHKCDRRACWAPHHVELGSQGQNWRDAVERGRARPFVTNTHAAQPEPDDCPF